VWHDLNSGLGSPLVQELTLGWSLDFCCALATLRQHRDKNTDSHGVQADHAGGKALH